MNILNCIGKFFKFLGIGLLVLTVIDGVSEIISTIRFKKLIKKDEEAMLEYGRK